MPPVSKIGSNGSVSSCHVCLRDLDGHAVQKYVVCVGATTYVEAFLTWSKVVDELAFRTIRLEINTILCDV